nr:reverse transcriptase domain-containing protein [Tanacetum cinerariifolium]
MRTRSRSRHKIAEPLRIEFHYQKEQFQEDPPVATMTDNRTMAEMLRAPTEGYAEAIVVPPILAEQFELKHNHHESEVDHNDSEDKDHLVDKFIKKFNKKIAKCHKRIEKANQQSKDLENQNKDLQDKYDVLKNQVNTFEEKNNEFNEQIKVLNEKNDNFLTQTDVLQEQFKVKHVVIDTYTECQAQYAKLEEERYQYMIRYSALCDNDKQRRKKIDEQKILFDKMSPQLVEMNNNELRLQEKILEKETNILELEECVRNKDLEIKKSLERMNDCQDSLNDVAGGNLLERSTQDVLTIIENQSKVRNFRSKSIASQVKAYNSKQPHLQLRLRLLRKLVLPAEGLIHIISVLPPVATLSQNLGTTSKSTDQQPQPTTIREPSYQATAQHNQNFHLNELERIKKMNEVSMKAMRNQIDMVKNELRNEMKTSIQTSLSNQTNKTRDMMASFLRMNTASPSSSGTLPGNTVANPKSDLKVITTRSGVSYDGPSISPPVVENAPEATKDTVIPTNNGNTEDVKPQVVSSKPPVSTSEPAITPVSASNPNLQASIPYPSRRNDERNREKAKDQINKFYQLFKDTSFEISFTDALILMPKFASTLKALIKLADRSISRPVGVAEDVYVKVGSFYFSADFVIADFDADPRVPLILERSFLKTRRALIDVFEGELTLRVGKEAITFNLDQTSRYFANYNDMTAKRIDVIDMACEEYSQEVLGFSDVTVSGNPTPIVSTTSSTLTPFGDSDFLLFEEANAFLGLEDDPDSPELDPFYYDPEGDIQMLEAILNSDCTPSLPNHEQSGLRSQTNSRLVKLKRSNLPLMNLL